MVINQRYTTGYKPKHFLVVTMDTDEDEDTMNSDDATSMENIYALQPSQLPNPQPPPQHSHLDPPCPDRVCCGQQKDTMNSDRFQLPIASM